MTENKPEFSNQEEKMTENYQYKEWLPIPAKTGYEPRRIQIPYFGADDPNVMAIESPSQPGDDDSLLIIWDRDLRIWTQHYGFSGSYSKPSEGFDERAALTLLEYFNLLDMAEEFSPNRLMSTSPEELQKIAESQ